MAAIEEYLQVFAFTHEADNSPWEGEWLPNLRRHVVIAASAAAAAQV